MKLWNWKGWQTELSNIVIIVIFLLLVAYLVSIIPDVASSQSSSIQEKELVFLEKNSDHGYHSVFESKEDEKYYAIPMTNWEYNNINHKEGEIFNIEIRLSESKSVDPVFIDIINAYTGIKYIDKQAFFMNEWKEIYEFNYH